MSVDEITTCASGFAVSGFGSPYFTNLLEQGVLSNIAQFSNESLKEIARGFIFSQRGSKTLLSVLLPRIRPILHEFTCSELCYLLNAYHTANYLPKQLASEIELIVKKSMLDGGSLELGELALIAQVFCKARTASREFHKLLETTILMKIPELRKEFKVLHSIGRSFEESGLCSLDTLKVLKKEAAQVEAEREVFN